METNTKIPYKGMPATRFVGSDSYPMIVIDVKSDKRIIVARMLDEDYKEYEKSPDSFNGKDLIKKYNVENGIEYTLRKNKRWLPKGYKLWETCSIALGFAEFYWDPSF